MLTVHQHYGEMDGGLTVAILRFLLRGSCGETYIFSAFGRYIFGTFENKANIII